MMLLLSLQSCADRHASIEMKLAPAGARFTLYGPQQLFLTGADDDRILGLPAGRYRLVAAGKAHRNGSLEFELANGEQQTVALSLAPLPAPLSPAGGLRRGAANPRYFETPAGESVFLAGSHTWNNLVDMDAAWPPREFDYPAYLDFLQTRGHNLTRIWAWPIVDADSERYPRRRHAAPQPWLRVGPARDRTGLPVFDLTKFDPTYFGRLGERVALAQARDIYAIVMLFEGWGPQFSPGSGSHPFARGNNINGIGPRELTLLHTLELPEVTALQEAYVRKVVGTVNAYDNVLFEISNESGLYSTAWQQHMIDLVREVEAGLPFTHPVGMTKQGRKGRNANLFASTADWISPGNDTGNYKESPEPVDESKLIIADTDHLGGSAVGDRGWVWKSFTRGLNLLFMDRYVAPDSVTDTPYERAGEIREALGRTVALAGQLDLGSLIPRPELASTAYVLAGEAELIVYAENADRFEVDLRGYAGGFAVSWWHPQNDQVLAGNSINAGRWVTLRPPYPHDAVLWLRALQ